MVQLIPLGYVQAVVYDIANIFGSSELSVENEINLGLTQSSTQIRLVRQ